MTLIWSQTRILCLLETIRPLTVWQMAQALEPLALSSVERYVFQLAKEGRLVRVRVTDSERRRGRVAYQVAQS